MKHICPDCKEEWMCTMGCSTVLMRCPDGCKKPDPCGCDNCEYIRRFGTFLLSSNSQERCRLCGNRYCEHTEWHCPEKKEWTLPSGVKVHRIKSYDGIKIVQDVGCTLCDAIYLGSPDYKALAKILQEIDGRER